MEFVDKLANPSLVETKSQKEITNFKSNLGDGSFLLIYDTKDSEFFKCVEELAENKYKLLFYVGYADKNIYNNYNPKIEVPSLIVKKFIYFFISLTRITQFIKNGIIRAKKSNTSSNKINFL